MCFYRFAVSLGQLFVASHENKAIVILSGKQHVLVAYFKVKL